MSGKVRGISWVDLLAYDPISGSLVWTVRRGFTKPGDVAGCVVNGYVYVTYLGERYRADVIAWELMTGVKRRKPIKFANGDRTDLRWSNMCGSGGAGEHGVEIGISVVENGFLITWFEAGKPTRSKTVANAGQVMGIMNGWVQANVRD